MIPRSRIVWAVCSVVLKDGKILCLKRQNSSFYDGHWGIPAGKLDSGEMPIEGAARELYEEAGITADPKSYDRHHVTYAKIRDTPDGVEGRLYYTGIPRHWEGEAINMEPHKASEMGWFPLSALPEPFVPTQKLTIEAIMRWEAYSEYEGRFEDSRTSSP